MRKIYLFKGVLIDLLCAIPTSGSRDIVAQCCGSGSIVSVWVLGLLDPDPLARGTDPDPFIKQNSKTNLDYYCFVTSS